jgi:cation diffusion facilitator family transporter
MPNESMRTVLVALGAGLGVAIAKAAAAAVTGSSALAAEAAHSLADTSNDFFLFVAQRRSSRPADDQHPLGYGREAYFWALIAAIGVFVAGAAFSLREGIDELINPGVTSSFLVGYIVLAVSTVFDLVSFRQSAGQLRRRAHRYHRRLIEESRVTSDPTLRAVFIEDAVSVSGDVMAFVALAINQITGSSVSQGVAAVVIALVLIGFSLRLIRRSHDFLVGAWVGGAGGPRGQDVGRFTQPIRATDEARVRTTVLGLPGVTAIRQLLFVFLGPGQVWIVARIDVSDKLRGSEVEALVRDIESALKQAEDGVYRVDVVPAGADVRREDEA